MASTKNPDSKKIKKFVALNKKHKSGLEPSKLFYRLRKGDKSALSQAITLAESSKENDQETARLLIQKSLPYSGKSLRIGITGVPGVGKSTFIEAFGKYITSQNKKVAVLAIDPSSEITQGSILGDKTRMVNLSADPMAYIRPTASSGSLGGVAKRTRENILLCEAAGFEIILIETVGVGQSETAVHSMTDFFLLLMLSAAGDELQGIKRGIMEMADAVVINKADGDNIKRANLAKAQFKNALHLFPAKESKWIPQAETVSSLENKNIDKIWKMISSFELAARKNGWLLENRKNQQVYWMNEAIKNTLTENFYSDKKIQMELKKLTERIMKNEITSHEAARLITENFKNGKKKI